MSDAAPTPSLRRLIESIIDERLSTIEGPSPGQVTAYNATKQRASVQPLISRIHTDESGERVATARPVLQDLPVLFLGGGGSRITHGVDVGDLVLIIPCAASIARWVVRGGQVDPGQATGSARDAIVIAGIHNDRAIPTSAPDALVLHGDDVRLGGSGADSAADRVVIRSTLDQLVSIIGTVGGTNPEIAALGAALTSASWPTIFVATKTKAE